MLDQLKRKSFEQLVAAASHEELIWMNGFLAGAASLHRQPAPLPEQQPAKLTILFGTETGNAKRLAGKLSAAARSHGVVARAVALDQYREESLDRERNVVVVISTQGDGEPPAAAAKFHGFIHATTARFPDLHYGVIALGDSSYPQFCQTGKEVDARFEALGAKRILPAQLCDTDYEEPALRWFGAFVTALGAGSPPVLPAAAPVSAETTKRHYTGRILRNINLNDRGSLKRTHHIEIAAEDLQYLPGDALGVVPCNPDAAVAAVLETAGLDAALQVGYRDERLPLGELLQSRVNIACLPARLVGKYATLVRQEIPAIPIALSDLLKIYPLRDASQFTELLAILEPIAPRLYSIASAPAAHPGELHLTVKRDEFRLQNEPRYGLCSDYLTNLPEGTALRFYIHPNRSFRLPAPEADIIMIGAGTGIAPFRSFVQERAATGAPGRNWLFFGDQHFSSDFLYQTEWQSLHESGVLTRINTAFSRDQAEKIYVQHRLKESGRAVYEWLTGGASVYVCGARIPMSADVERALQEIIAGHGGKSASEAAAFLEMLSESGRYQKDVY